MTEHQAVQEAEYYQAITDIKIYLSYLDEPTTTGGLNDTQTIQNKGYSLKKIYPDHRHHTNTNVLREKSRS